MTVHQKQLEDYRRGNVAAAEIIAADPDRYPPGSLMAIVAEMVLQGGINIRAELERRAGLEQIGTCPNLIKRED
jgi:hypothetical protein